MTRAARWLFLLVLTAMKAEAMEFRVAGNELHLSGRVTGDELGMLRDVEAAYPGRIDTVVFRDSPGGDAWSGFRVGERIRDHGWRTVVIGACVSACTLMFLGGRTRHFGVAARPGRMLLGFHGPSSANFLDRGAAAPRGRPEVRAWIESRTGGKADPALVERFVGNEKRATLLLVYDPEQLARSDGVSTLFCEDSVPKGKSPFDACEKLAGKDAFSMGFINSPARVKVQPPASLPSPYRRKLPEFPK